MINWKAAAIVKSPALILGNTIVDNDSQIVVVVNSDSKVLAAEFPHILHISLQHSGW